MCNNNCQCDQCRKQHSQPLLGDTFWLVWCEGGGVPRKKHATSDDAAREAARLAKERPGLKFYILSSAGYKIGMVNVTVESH